jgi:hypothetical protein
VPKIGAALLDQKGWLPPVDRVQNCNRLRSVHTGKQRGQAGEQDEARGSRRPNPCEPFTSTCIAHLFAWLCAHLAWLHIVAWLLITVESKDGNQGGSNLHVTKAMQGESVGPSNRLNVALTGCAAIGGEVVNRQHAADAPCTCAATKAT